MPASFPHGLGGIAELAVCGNLIFHKKKPGTKIVGRAFFVRSRLVHKVFDKSIRKDATTHHPSGQAYLFLYRRPQEFRQRPTAGRDPGSHRGRSLAIAARFVFATKVVPSHEQRSHGRVMTGRLRVSVRQPREPSHVHSHRQVEPLRVGSRSAGQIRVAESRNDFDAGYRRGAVPRFVLATRVALDDLREVHPRAQFVRHVVRVDRQAIGRDLNASRSGDVQAAQERQARGLVTLASDVREDHFRIRTNREPRPTIARIFAGDLFELLCLGLHAEKIPDFVQLDGLASHVANERAQPRIAVFTHHEDQVANRLTLHAGDSFGRANAHPLQEQAENERGFVHFDPHIAERTLMAAGQDRTAVAALPTLSAIAILAVLCPVRVLALSYHFLSLCSRVFCVRLLYDYKRQSQGVDGNIY